MDDCVIIGGGPAGLTAALYLARFRVSCAVLDSGHSRAARIPRCRNYPTYPDGIAGAELLGLNQITTSVGNAAVAATAIRNELRC